MKNYIIFGIVAVVVVFAATQYLPGRTSEKKQPAAEGSATVTESINTNQPVIAGEKITMPGGLIIQDVKVGTGDEAKTGSLVRVNYVGTFVDGKKFDASADHVKEMPDGFTFPLGQGNVIKGWDEGVVGMKVGGVRKLTVPPELGYGPNDYGPIPGNSTLLFEVELLAVRYK